MKTKIYFLRDENRFVKYVGKTGGILEHRLRYHLYEALKGHKCKRCNGIRAMLRRGFSPTIDLITEVDGNGAGAERAYIKWLRSKGIDLWNLTDGGEGNPGHIVSEKTRAQIRAKLKGKTRPKEACQKMSDSHTGKPWSKAQRDAYEAKKKINNVKRKPRRERKGWHHSEETKRKITGRPKGIPAWNKNVPATETARLNMSAAHVGIPWSDTRRKANDKHPRIPWNKGKKGLQIAWNKGIKIN